MSDDRPLTVTEVYDSSHDPITACLPPMVPGFRILVDAEVAAAMGFPTLRVVEPMPDMRPAVTASDVDRWMRDARKAYRAIGGTTC